MNEIETTEPAAIIKATRLGMQLQSLGDYESFACCVQASGLAPKTLNTTAKILVAVQTGAELGMTPMQSLRSVAVINGTPTVYGDALLGMVRQSGQLEYIKESIDGSFCTDLTKVDGATTAVCTVKRMGDPEPVTVRFSVAEARLARLWEKTGPWSTHPQRMLKYKARAFALRDTFPDILMGLHLYEEIQGEEPIHVESTQVECSANALLGESDDGIRAEGQPIQPVQEQPATGGQDGPGLHGQGDDRGPVGVGGCVDQEDADGDVPVVRGKAKAGHAGKRGQRAKAGDAKGRDILDPAEVNGQADATEDDGVRDGTEAEPALFEDEGGRPSGRFACDKCGAGYNHRPEDGKCRVTDDDDFPCMGKVRPT